MSTQIRKYELKARADSQRETRAKIARTAAELHEEIGVARTTVAEIARRAGVTRLTVYNHFPDLTSLLPACSAHYESEHPPPDLDGPLSLPDPQDRAVAALEALYGWYRETAPLFSKAFGDRHAVPELDEFLADSLDRMQDELAAALAGPLTADPDGDAAGDDRADDSERCRVLLRLAADFATWQRLDREGLDDRDAARLMTSVARGC